MNPVAVLRHAVDREHQPLGDVLYVWCPGCNSAHSVNVSGSLAPLWSWDGSLEAPTISPSILCYNSAHLCDHDHYAKNECFDHYNCGVVGHAVTWDGPDETGRKHYWHGEPHTSDPAWGNCHSFLRAGVWEFLGDSAHRLAGQHTPMVPLPDWLLPQ